MDRLMPGAYRLTVTHPGRAAGGRVFWAEPGENSLLPLVLVPSATIGGRVVDDLGNPVPGARVRPVMKTPQPGPVPSVRTDKAGRFLLDGLAQGVHRLEVSAAAHAVSVVARVRAPARSVEVVLTRLYSVSGLVSPMPPGGGEVEVRLAGSGVWPERLAKPDASGKFRFEEVPAGIYDLMAGTGQQPWMASAPARGVQVGPAVPPPVKLELKPAEKITGQVRHEDKPVPGAVVVLGQDTLSVLRARVVTDKEGKFALGPVPLGRYSLGIWASGYLPIPEHELELPLKGPLQLDLSRGAAVTGVVQDDQGVPLQGAVIWVIYGVDPIPGLSSSALGPGPRTAGELGVMPGPVPPIPPSGAWTAMEGGDGGPSRTSGRAGQDGRFKVEGLWPGRMRIIADLHGFMQVRSPWLTLEQDEETELLGPLVLKPAATLTGRVLDELGVPLDGARLEASFNDDHQRVAFADMTGGFRLEGLAGKVELTVSQEGYLPLTREVDLSRGVGWPLVELDLVLKKATGQVTGLVLDARRLPLAGVLVTARWGKHRVEAVSQRSGRFTLDGVGQGQLTLTVAHQGYLPLTRAGVKAGEQVELRLGYAAAVEGQVRDLRTGGPIKAFKLSLAGQSTAPAPIMVQRLKLGRFRMDGVAPGAHTLQASSPGYAQVSRKIKVRVPSSPGAVGLDSLVLELGRAGSIRGQVLDSRREGVARATVSAAGVTARTNRLGNFKLEDLPEGNHAVKVTHGKKAKQTDPVVVRAGEVTRGIRVELE